ncbi:MAG: Ig-like domain-containing protein, partial [Burkholderiales bacterium]
MKRSSLRRFNTISHLSALLLVAVLAVRVSARFDGVAGAAGRPGGGEAAELQDTGLAAQYPGDAGIENDPAVIFVEKFEETALATVFSRWTDILNGSAMSLATDVPSGSTGTRSLNVPWTGGGVLDGGHLYKQLTPGVDDTLYVRYYVKYPTTGRHSHNGIWMGGYNPALGWPNPQAGIKPAGTDRFSAAAEQAHTTASFDHYNYWMNMRQSADGQYWGNVLLNDPSVQGREGQWMCVEHMVKLNNPVTASNGEHAIWIDGVKVSHLGQGFPNGTWSYGNFVQDPGGTPFEGFRWRSNTNLHLNYIWLQTYAPNDPAGFSASMRFDHVVAARSYIGCLASATQRPPAAPTNVRIVSGTATPAPVAQVTVAPASASVAKGATRQLTATLRDAGGNVLTGRAVAWSSSNTP